VDDSLKAGTITPRNNRALLVAVIAPALPQILGSIFNIWYNTVVTHPLLTTEALQTRFHHTVIFFNLLVYPLAVGVWVYAIYRLRPIYRRLRAGLEIPPDTLRRSQRWVVDLPWIFAATSGSAWMLCIPVFLGALSLVPGPLDPKISVHLPISFAVSAFIAVTQGMFLVEIVSHRGLFPVFFRNTRPDRISDGYPLTIRTRGLLWAISAGFCPIGSLLLLSLVPTITEQYFEFFVGFVGIAFGLCSALLMSRLVADPVDQLRLAAHSIGKGNYNVQIPLERADEFGALIGEFNNMVSGLREKERLRKTFGLHVGIRAVEQILAHDPGLNGSEQEITAMFVDIRDFTKRSAKASPSEVVLQLNEFFGLMVAIIEREHEGMVNKFLGDGFMALFGVGTANTDHAGDALRAAGAMMSSLKILNARLLDRGEEAIAVGIGIHSGLAVVGCIGSPERLEYTAIGATLNLASRIEGLTKVAGESVLCSEATRNAMLRPVKLRALDPRCVKGIADPVPVFTLAHVDDRGAK
jgi:adenylate cyclase